MNKKYPDNIKEIFEINKRDLDRTLQALLLMGVTGTQRGLKSALNRAADVKSDKPVKPLSGGRIAAPDEFRSVLKGKRFLFTSAQNNTDVHEGFLTALETYAAFNDAQIIISPFTYNKNGFQNGTKDDDKLWYDPKIEKYIRRDSIQVTPNLVFCGELNILPTAGDPLSGLENYCCSSSGIIPHAKMTMRSLPSMPTDGARFMYTTGTVTQRNYIQKKSGQKAEFHHVFGALLIEIDDNGDFHARQLVADKTGSFYDLTKLYRYDKLIEEIPQVKAINWGDIHAEKFDAQVNDASFYREDSILNELKPTLQFIHDLSDFTARNHHNIKDPHFLAKQFRDNATVESGIKLAADFLESIQRPYSRTVVVESNHDLAFQKWLKEADVKNDPANARYYHEANAKMYSVIEAGIDKDFSIFEWALICANTRVEAKFLSENDSFVICKDRGGIECGLHGHIGPNGSRGSPRNLRTLGRKVNTGHTHTAGIVDGVYTAGVTAKLDMDYNKGPSSWSNSHIVTYPNGKRAIITVNRKGKWRA